MIFEAKRPTWDAYQTIFTIEHFQEMIRFEEWLLNLEYPVPIRMETADIDAGEPPTMLTFKDTCKRVRRTSDSQERKWRNKCKKDARYCDVKPRV